MYLVVIDYCSEFIEVESLKEDTKSEMIIERLTKMFAAHGIPDKLVTDNDPKFISHKFKQFVNNLHFTHVTTSPHPHKANGMVERANQTVRHLIEKSQEDNNNFYLALLNLGNTPRHTDTGCPAQRLFGRRTKTISCQLPKHY